MNRERMIESVLAACRDNLNFHVYRWQAEVIVDKMVADLGDDFADFHVRRTAPDTSKAIVDKIRAGSLQDAMLALFITWSVSGLTDDEIETRMGRTHQSVSACRNTLMRKGYVVDSGKRRRTRSGNEAIVWTWTGKGRA